MVEFLCLICLETAEVPFWFETCKDLFCYTCIMKHLRTKSFCPKCGIPVTRFDLETNLKKVRNLRIPILKSRIEKIKALKKYKINTVGSNSVIDNRFLDLIDILYKEQYKERILSNTEIGYKVNVTTLNTNKILNKKDPKIIEALLELRKNLK